MPSNKIAILDPSRQFHVQDILKMSPVERLSLPDGGLYLTFDDGKMERFKTRTTIQSAYYWDLSKKFPGLKITSDHHMGNGDYTSSTHTTIGAKLFWDTFFASNDHSQKAVWDISREMYVVTNTIYNIYVNNLFHYAASLSIDDMTQILTHDVTTEATRRFFDKQITLDQCHDIIYGLMTSDDYPELESNQIRQACRAGILSKRQIKQMVSVRGVIPDCNGETFEHIVEPGYVEGLNTFHDGLIETRTASIALYATTAPLEASEYNNRQCQLSCNVIRRVTYGPEGDCGTKYHLNMPVTASLLSSLRGKNMIDKDGKVKMIMGTEKELVGKVVKIRSITKCSNPGKQTVCSTCLGFNSFTVPPGTNVGHHLTIEPNEKISQTILGTKHVIASAIALALEISGNAGRFIRADDDNMFNVYLKPADDSAGRRLRVNKDDVIFINDIFHTDDISSLRINSISDVNEIEILELDEEGVIKLSNKVPLMVGGKGSPLSHEFLTHIKETRWEVKGKYVEFTLENWDYDNPIVVTNPISKDIMKLFNAFKTFLHSPSDSRGVRLNDFVTVEDAIVALHGIIGELDVNFSQMEIFIKALMAKGESSYGLPRPDEKFRFITLRESLHNRSAGNMLAFQEMSSILPSPEAFTRRHKDIPSSPLDDRWRTGLGEGLLPEDSLFYQA